MFGLFRRHAMREVTPNELKAMIADGTALVVDVREHDEFASGHIADAVNLPLSTFDPAALPDPGARTLVLNCAGGKRSAMALGKCAVAQAAVDTHLAGGIGAWKAAGLPVTQGA
ncbi:rhodanese-like domain-containing protein [Sphingomonas sp.]|uniref:rhodanese-like domain-containing protein n=1 Tax=Sphingomonas sp. TaxID=28214 RepID=UPI003BACCFE2